MEAQTLRVSVVGFGDVGATLAYLLINSHDVNIHLNIMDPSPLIEGRLLDMAHALALDHRHIITLNDKNALQQADFIFMAAGYRNAPGASRLSVAKQNIGLTREIFTGLKWASNPMVVVLTNPVEIVCHHLHVVSGIPSRQIAGTGTLLDSVRLAYYLAQSLNVKPKDVEAWILGEHGASMVPVFSQTKVNGIPVHEFPLVTRQLLDKCMEETLQAANTIRRTQGSTYYGVAQCASQVFHAIRKDQPIRVPLSVAVDEQHMHMLRCNPNLFISLPVTVDRNGWTLHGDFNLTREETEGLKRSAQVIAGYL
ncbi:MAG: hypothetical protein H6585_06990 [Flavobacteriales bacterium]|nr:hypothetical protein [Flavobacteriales bacterium]MCB9448076.1 hypothetical protein [Flavobacteriales bacterium]